MNLQLVQEIIRESQSHVDFVAAGQDAIAMVSLLQYNRYVAN